jgi:pilus assembly protein CpaF
MIPFELHVRNVRALLAPIATLLDDPAISEIMINGADRIYAERQGRLRLTSCRFDDKDALIAAVRAVAQYAQRELGAETPILEARLPDGSRIEAVLPPAAPNGPIVAIRRFSENAMTLETLVERGSVEPTGAALLRAMVEQRRNVLVSGGTGSGKTSLLNVLAGFIPPDQRIVVIEDARELRLPHDHVVQLEARPPDARGRGELTIRDLFKASLRLRPDRIVVGEIRGREALELISAMTSGHDGCLSTIHATSPGDALARLETLALSAGLALPLWALRSQIASAIDVVVQTSRMPDGSRQITDISEVGLGEQAYLLEQRYRSARASRAGSVARSRSLMPEDSP